MINLNRVYASTLLLLILVIALSACGNGAPADDINIGEGTFIETQFVAPLPASEALPVNVDDLADGAFVYSISGAANETVSGEGTFIDNPGQGWFIGLSKHDAVDDHVISGVSFTMPTGTESGTYRLFPQRQVYNLLQEVVGIGGMYFDDLAEADSAIPFRTFDNITAGKITLATFEPLTGAFEFTAQSPGGNEVTVSGAFKNLTMTLSESID